LRIIKNYKEEEFRRLNGFKRSTFEKMVEILAEAERKKARATKSNNLPIRKDYNDFRVLKGVSNIP